MCHYGRSGSSMPNPFRLLRDGMLHGRGVSFLDRPPEPLHLHGPPSSSTLLLICGGHSHFHVKDFASDEHGAKTERRFAARLPELPLDPC